PLLDGPVAGRRFAGPAMDRRFDGRVASRRFAGPATGRRLADPPRTAGLPDRLPTASLADQPRTAGLPDRLPTASLADRLRATGCHVAADRRTGYEPRSARAALQRHRLCSRCAWRGLANPLGAAAWSRFPPPPAGLGPTGIGGRARDLGRSIGSLSLRPGGPAWRPDRTCSRLSGVRRVASLGGRSRLDRRSGLSSRSSLGR